jgi:hypothetical protein
MKNAEEAKNYESFLRLFCASANSILQGSAFYFIESLPEMQAAGCLAGLHPRQS